jgi:hypothetical protein
MHPQITVDMSRCRSTLDVLDREVAQIVGVPVATVRRWRKGERRAPHQAYRATCPRCNGRPLDEPTYSYLLGLYLGDGWLTLGRRGVFALSIACCDAWPGLITTATQAMSAVMPDSGVFSVQRIGITEVKSTSKHWPCLFPQHGPGRKHKRRIQLEDWQWEIIRRFPGDFVRGLFHSDGWRGVNRVRRTVAGVDHWYEYPRYLFSNKSQDILELCGEALDMLGVAWRYSRPDNISVAKRDAVARLDEFVGPKY